MVQVQEAEDGTYTLLLNGQARMTGLTRAQAEKLATSFEARRARPPSALAAGETAKAVRRAWRWRDLFRLRGSAL